MLHSIIAASSAGIWGKPNGCTAWPLMSQQFPETEPNLEALEGEAAHEISSVLINEPNLIKYEFDYFDGKTATNGELFTEDMYDIALVYVNDVLSIFRELNKNGRAIIKNEQRLDIKRVHDIAFGTCDNFIYHQASGSLYIHELKAGYDYVDVFENWQMLMYLCGILDRLSIDGTIDQKTTVYFRVIQPQSYHRDGPIKEWVINAADCRAYFNILSANAHIALGNNPIARSGSHCKHCTARHACPPALQSGFQLYEVAKQPVAMELSPLALGVQLGIVDRAIKQLECIKEGMKEQTKGIIRRGQAVPGWTMEPCGSKEVWTKPMNEIVLMGDQLEKDLRNNKILTVKQARTKGIADDVLAAYSTKQSGGLQLVPDNGNKARRLFK